MSHQPRYAIALDRGRIVEGEAVYDYGVRVLVNTRRQGFTADEAEAEMILEVPTGWSSRLVPITQYVTHGDPARRRRSA